MTSKFGKLKLLFLLLIMTVAAVAQKNGIKHLPSEIQYSKGEYKEQVNFEYDDLSRIIKYTRKSNSTETPSYESILEYSSDGRLLNMKLKADSLYDAEIYPVKYIEDTIFHGDNVMIIDKKEKPIKTYSSNNNAEWHCESEFSYDTVENRKMEVQLFNYEGFKYMNKHTCSYTDQKGVFFDVNIPDWEMSLIFADLISGLAKKRVDSITIEGIDLPPDLMGIRGLLNTRIKLQYTEVSEQNYPLKIESLDKGEKICYEIKYIEVQ